MFLIYQMYPVTALVLQMQVFVKMQDDYVTPKLNI